MTKKKVGFLTDKWLEKRGISFTERQRNFIEIAAIITMAFSALTLALAFIG